MAWVMSVLGAVLAMGGGYALWAGSGYIRLDWGQAETVAGTVALSAGILAIGLAAVLFALRDLARASARAAGRDALAPAAPARGRTLERLATVGLPRAETAAADRDEPFNGAQSFAEPDLRAADAAPGHDRHAADDAGFAAAAAGEAATVVGRYEANGASYVLFSDGTIEVETEAGTHRFDSMAHLKDHIERQDAG